MRNGPDYIQFYPTLRCNQSCEFCFNKDLAPLPDMLPDEFTVMLRQLVALQVRTLDIMGGEPTLHPQIAEFIQEAVQSGLKVNISSNGSNTTVLENLLKIGNNVTIGISINDHGSRERLAGFIQNNKVVVKSIVRPEADREFVRDIIALKPKKVYLIYRDALDPQDNSAAIPFHQFISSVKEQFDHPLVGTVFCSGFLSDTANYPELARVRCPAGTTKLGVLPDGSVYPCNLFFGKKQFLLGNILNDPFGAIWNHEALAFFRSSPRNHCPDTTCELHTRCHGGCPAHSFAHFGSLSALDPRCIR